MRLLLVTPFLPGPDAAHGGGAYLASLASGLRRRAEVGIACFGTPAEMAGPDRGQWAWAGLAPWPDRHADGRHLWDRLRMLWRWRRVPLVAAKHQSWELSRQLARALAEWRPDAALVEMAQMAHFLPDLAAVPTVLTDHEAGCPANTHTGLGRLGDARDRRLWHRFVHRHYPLAGVIQALTTEDAGHLQQVLGRSVLVRPPTVTVPELAVRPAAAPPHALFLGDYRHAPNPEAATRLAREVVPRIRERRPDFVLRLAGANIDRVRHLAGAPGIELAGFVPDLRQLLGSVRLVLAPLYSGDGVRMKNLVALAHGVPVVTNPLGARGIAAPTSAMRRGEGAAELAQHCLALLDDPAAAAAAGSAAHAWARANLDVDAVAAQQLQLVQELLANRPR